MAGKTQQQSVTALETTVARKRQEKSELEQSKLDRRLEEVILSVENSMFHQAEMT